MNAKTHTIEVDGATAAALAARAAELGLTVPELVAELIAEDRGPETTFADQLTELERRWEVVPDLAVFEAAAAPPGVGAVPASPQR